MTSRFLFLLLTTLSLQVFALDTAPPAILSNVDVTESIEFDVWSRSGDLKAGDLDASIVAFTGNQIASKFLLEPARYADRFYPVNRSNYTELVEFRLLYEPYVPFGSDPSACDNTWHYYLSVAMTPRGKHFAISRLIIHSSGQILYGFNVSPYDWPETGCPMD
ncbi:MAG: hypothetical protein ACR2QW_00400 [bacterium]